MKERKPCGKCGGPNPPRVGRGSASPYCDGCRAICSVAECAGGRVEGSSLCSFHKSRVARGTSFDRPRRASPGRAAVRCSVDGCVEPQHAHGHCKQHYQAAARVGVLPRVYAVKRGARGRRHNGYLEVPHPERPLMVRHHRLVMEELIGRPLLRHETVHHCNGDRGDNRSNGPLVNFRSGNLELWSKSQPAGQRVTDKVAWAVELLELYAPEHLATKPVQIGTA